MKRKNGTKKSGHPKQPLDKDLILSAAVAMADKAGLESLTMRALAAHLNVEAMSLYHHLPNKDALIDAMVEHVIGQITLPCIEKPWLPEMRRRAHSALATLTHHPWVTLPILSRINVGANMLTYLDRTHGCLLAAGFDHEGADRAHHLMDNHIYGFALQELHFPLQPEEYAAGAESFLPMIPASQYPHLRGIAEAIACGDYDGRNSFEFGLNIILEGLYRLLKKSGKEGGKKNG